MINEYCSMIRAPNSAIDRILMACPGWGIGDIESIVADYLREYAIRSEEDREREGGCKACGNFAPAEGRCLELGRCDVTGKWVAPDSLVCQNYNGSALKRYTVCVSLGGTFDVPICARSEGKALELAEKFFGRYDPGGADVYAHGFRDEEGNYIPLGESVV